MPIDEALARRFMVRFEGYADAYGTYNKDKATAEVIGGKVEIRSSAVTRRRGRYEPPLDWLKLWLNHLNGVEPLGVIPIRDNNTCYFGVNDIDEYGVIIGSPQPLPGGELTLYQRYDKEDAPVIISRSKSDAAHGWVFFGTAVSATPLQLYLQETAAMIGYGGSEVFPKQRQVALERGDLGSWINMPYFGDTRWAVDREGNRIPPDKFMDLVEAMAARPPWLLERYMSSSKDGEQQAGEAEFKDGPPCMQRLSVTGIGEGARNEGMMAFGVFAKKKYPNDWEEALVRWNAAYCKPKPLPPSEIADIIKRLRQKDYYYPCKKQPIVAHCQSALCRTRRHGVASGTTDMLPIIGGMSVLPTEPPLWFLDVGEHRLELTTANLTNYKAFQNACSERLFVRFQGMTQKAWDEVLAVAMRDINKIEVTEEVGLGGQFHEILEDFVCNQPQAETRDEILLGKPWLDDEAKNADDHRYYFRLKHLENSLSDANFKVYSRGQIVTRLRALGGDNHVLALKGKNAKERKNVRVWWLPKSFSQITPTPVPPPVPPEPI
jgi:hypothetical protein